jgi:hypothetical protein
VTKALSHAWAAGNSPTKHGWLVVSTPLKNMSQLSQLGLFFSKYGKIKNVPNHQPD